MNKSCTEHHHDPCTNCRNMCSLILCVCVYTPKRTGCSSPPRSTPPRDETEVNQGQHPWTDAAGQRPLFRIGTQQQQRQQFSIHAVLNFVSSVQDKTKVKRPPSLEPTFRPESERAAECKHAHDSLQVPSSTSSQGKCFTLPFCAFWVKFTTSECMAMADKAQCTVQTNNHPSSIHPAKDCTSRTQTLPQCRSVSVSFSLVHSLCCYLPPWSGVAAFCTMFCLPFMCKHRPQSRVATAQVRIQACV